VSLIIPPSSKLLVPQNAEVDHKLASLVVQLMQREGYSFEQASEPSLIFNNQAIKTTILIDIGICQRQDLQYVDYTQIQNRLMAESTRLLRFSVESDDDLNTLPGLLGLFLSDEENQETFAEQIRSYGADREHDSIDPSRPEERFELLFSQAFGERSLYALKREQPFTDYQLKTRYIDYVLHTKSGRIAIELNGESFHHPFCIKHTKYSSQLIKQNSLVMSGWKVYRWSLRGMQDSERFIQEMKQYFGPSEGFESAPSYMAPRALGFFRLMEHQEKVLDRLDQERSSGKNTFLIELPTGTGKTEVLIEDFRRIKAIRPCDNGLILVPTRNLRDQTLAKLRNRLPHLRHGTEYQPAGESAGFMVQTYHHLIRHFEEFSPEAVSYLAVDEAHHAVAPGVQQVLEHFQPATLIGLTATPDRLDEKRLEQVFGSYQSDLSLQEAIETALLPPIRAFRIETNIDLSEVRYNGIDYTQSDLQKTILFPSRDRVVADVIEKYFGPHGVQKQGVVFCVSVNHTKQMAKFLNEKGIIAEAVSGSDWGDAERAIANYMTGKTRFVCACSLLTEGWDAPQTSILVMARPTMSKALYMQQLGRGTRSYPGKEALYVLDVVDRYGPLNAPWSIHAIFNQPFYQPWSNLVQSPGTTPGEEQVILANWLSEEERRISEINLFTFQKQYEDFLNEEQLARELFISTGTIQNWMRKGDIRPDVEVPFGKRALYYFNPGRVEEIREMKKLKVHDESTQYEDFFEFLKARDYTFSCKIIFLLEMLTFVNKRGEADLEKLTLVYRDFYLNRLKQRLPVERANSSYNREDYLNDLALMSQSLLSNPFEKFERKRFMHHCKDLKYIAFTTCLWQMLGQNPQDRGRIFAQMVQDLADYYQKLGGLGDISFLTENFPETAPHLALQHQISTEPAHLLQFMEPETSEKYRSCLPFYDLAIAAGGFITGDAPEPSGWVDVSRFSKRRTLRPGMFLAQVVGRSMQPTIPDGAVCLFSTPVTGSRQGRIVLVQRRGLEDPETGGNYTVKRYHSVKSTDLDTWRHEQIELRPDNPEFQVISFQNDDVTELRVIAEMLEVLDVGQKTAQADRFQN